MNSIINVSVIIPVYNTAKYIRDTLLSVMNQTLKDIEILVINDGSTDNSLEIISEIQKSDKRIRVYNQENKGQATARNKGLEEASGEYIYLMDSDDLLAENALETCYNRCKSERLDFAFFDAENFCEDGSIHFSTDYDRRGKIDEQVYSGLSFLKLLLEIGEYRVPPWLYFINREFLSSTGLKFVSGLLHEDQIFTAKLFVEAERVGYIPEKFFKRRLRPNSIMTSKYSMRNIETYYVVVSDLMEYSKDKSTEVKVVIDRIIKNTLNSALFAARGFPIKDKVEIIKKCRADFLPYVYPQTKVKFLFPSGIKGKTNFSKNQ